jgi:hypothetical protein
VCRSGTVGADYGETPALGTKTAMDWHPFGLRPARLSEAHAVVRNLDATLCQSVHDAIDGFGMATDSLSAGTFEAANRRGVDPRHIGKFTGLETR